MKTNMRILKTNFAWKNKNKVLKMFIHFDPPDPTVQHLRICPNPNLGSTYLFRVDQSDLCTRLIVTA